MRGDGGPALQHRGHASDHAAAPPSVALVMYGKLGSETARSWQSPRASPAVVATSYFAAREGLMRHLPHVAVFGHTWSPQVGPLLRELWRPLAFEAEKDASRQMERACVQRLEPVFAPAHMQLGTCGRTISHLLGMAKAIRLKSAYERARNVTYDVAVVARWDMVWFGEPQLARWLLAPALHRRLSHAPFWLPHQCADFWEGKHHSPHQQADRAAKEAACGGGAGPTLVPTGTQECPSRSRGCDWDFTPMARGLFVLDWFFVASSSAADAFSTLDLDGFYNMTTFVREELVSAPKVRAATGPIGREGVWIFSHLYWAHWMMRHLRADIGWLPVSPRVNFGLARMLQGYKGECDPSHPRLARLSAHAPPMAPLTVSAAARSAAWPTRADFGNASCPGTPGFHGRRFTCLPSSEACQGRALRGATAVGSRATGGGASAGTGDATATTATTNASDPTAPLRRLQAFMRAAPAVASASCPLTCGITPRSNRPDEADVASSSCGRACAAPLRALWARQ